MFLVRFIALAIEDVNRQSHRDEHALVYLIDVDDRCSSHRADVLDLWGQSWARLSRLAHNLVDIPQQEFQKSGTIPTLLPTNLNSDGQSTNKYGSTMIESGSVFEIGLS